MKRARAEVSRQRSAAARKDRRTPAQKRADTRRELQLEVDRAHAAIDHAGEHGSNEAYITWDASSYRPLANKVARVLRRERYHAYVVKEFSIDMGLVLSISW